MPIALSFLPYAAGKQQLVLEMPQTQHLGYLKSSQSDNHLLLQISKDSVQCTGSFLCAESL